MTEPERHLSADDAFLRKYAGVREATPLKLAELAARTAARDAYELRHSLMLPAVAALLGASEHRIIRLTETRELYAHELAGVPRWADWQFGSLAGPPACPPCVRSWPHCRWAHIQ